MSWFKPARRACFAVAVSLTALAGCTIAPLHGDVAANIVTDPLPLIYASANSRLEQVFYQAVAARLGTAISSDAPQLTASISISASEIPLSERPSPIVERQVVASVSYRVIDGGATLSSGTRTATAHYRTTGQLVADDAAQQNAREEAVRAAAQSIVATLLATPALQ